MGKFLDCLNLPTETCGESFAAGAKAAEWQTAVFFCFLRCSPGACFAGIPRQMMTTSHIKMVGTYWMYGMHCNQNRKLHCKKQVARSRGVGHWKKCIAMWKLCETVFQSIETTADVAESNQARNSPTYNGSGSQQCWKQFSFDANIGCVVRTSVVLETRQGVSQQPSEPLRFYEEVIQLFGRNSAVGKVFHAFFKVYFNREHHPNSKTYLY